MTENKSFSFIESAVVLGFQEDKDFQQTRISAKHFALFGGAYTFLNDYYNEHGSAPPSSLLFEKFPELDSTAQGVDLGYSVVELKKQSLYRDSREVILKHTGDGQLQEDPKAQIRKIVHDLSDLEITSSDNLSIYDGEGDLSRYEDYKQRKSQRTRMSIIGIPTPIRSINSTGIGWLPGNLISFYARPAMGKTWMTLKAAAVAALRGYKTLFISPEMPIKDISFRLDAIFGNAFKTSFSHSALRRGDPIDEEEYKDFLSRLTQGNLFLCDSIDGGIITLPGILSLVRQHEPDMVVVDGAMLIAPDQKMEKWEQMYHIFYAFKNLCTNKQMVAFISTQAKRNQNKQFDPPGPDEVLWGDGLLQASDVAFSMCMHSEVVKRRKIYLQKYRDDDPPFRYIDMDWDVNRGIIRESDEKIYPRGDGD